ncbi:symmetrical bis(5'-nucleosyl)-tetraphosphatase [Curvibacter sp. HBC61]|uniref:Bis(5'-nucleosyl)-tetraphosphatase, symmetrical n=1 Tax=Curvibacter cyanobacteriorum TaxID=3026422 RepID=A0ABT5MWI0_9BURK|nr:symmetrical bis(5'-nucleosyl)-tetraphosphatase [Curvibacter sp. HBC61]MDD0838375.1 symmetrical bis(5'-nucleosyl)-tetraphosphatase [Curvibacter sp. HBC61]
MAMYLIGDIQGCNDALGRLLAALDFSPSRDTVYLLGDLVNRGPDSLGTLRRLMALGDSARCLLGNHDLHLLAAAHGVRPAGRKDTLTEVLQAPDREALLNWVRHQPLARQEAGVLMVHAGVLPSWTPEQVLALAAEVQAVLRSDDLPAFLAEMYGNLPNAWNDRLQGASRLRVIVNALTRLRYCTAEGEMEFASTEGEGEGPEGYLPWFDVPGRRTEGVTVAFGHWSTLGWKQRDNLMCLDTGCVWGGCLSAVRLGATPADRTLIQVKCAQSQKPGGR